MQSLCANFVSACVHVCVTFQFLFLAAVLKDHINRYEMYSILLPICMVATAVKAM
jgi:hypothetical protein